ncbi:hypothetical protein MHW99_08095, partial [Corynebacterium sp. ACRPX]
VGRRRHEYFLFVGRGCSPLLLWGGGCGPLLFYPQVNNIKQNKQRKILFFFPSNILLIFS